MRVKNINRPALIAWNPNFENSSVIACGTVSRSNYHVDSKLELFDVSTEEPRELLSISVPSSFNKIVWTSVEANRKDLVIGAFNSSKIEIYDIQTLLNAESDGLVNVPKLHSGPVKALGLSCFQPNLLASGSTNGEIALWDLDNINKSSLISVKKSEKFNETSDLAWNPRIPHIIAVASISGAISITDLRSKKEISSFTLPESAGASSIAWNPETPTSILTSSLDDSHPYAYLWDLRSVATPQNTFKGHTQGITSLSWCQKDAGMVLSSGKDSKVFCWNPISNEIIKEYSCEDVFNAHWCPKDPNVICFSSYSNNISFHSLAENTDDRLYCSQSPKWLSCPIGASFGGENYCSIFTSASNKIKVIKPRIDVISNSYNDLIQFESDFTRLHLIDICNNLASQTDNSNREAFLEILKAQLSSDPRNEIIKLVREFDMEKLSDLSISEKISDYGDDSIRSPVTSTFDDILTEKIVRFDYEGAMIDCISAQRFFDAIIISDCGGNELRKKAENIILKSNNPTYLQLARSIRHNNFDDFVLTTPLTQWKNILEVICAHSEANSFVRLLSMLSDRLISEGLHKPACYSLILSGNLEEFLEIFLNHNYTLNLSSNSIIEILDILIFDYKVLRIAEAYQPGLIKSFKKCSNKAKVFEISVKLKAILSSFGFKECVSELLNSDFYSDNFKYKNADIDSFIANQQSIVQRNYGPRRSLEVLPITNSTATGFATNDFSAPASQITPYAPPKPVLNGLPIPSWQTSTIKYNDAPIVNPNLSKLSPQLAIQELKIDVVNRALKSLSDAIESKNITENHSRLVNECFKKLIPEAICSQEYSNISRQSIISLFNELCLGKFEKSATLAANILASFFSETKEWILSLKRLIEIAKI